MDLIEKKVRTGQVISFLLRYMEMGVISIRDCADIRRLGTNPNPLADPCGEFIVKADISDLDFLSIPQ